MPRFFVPTTMVDASSIDFERSDLTGLVAIREVDAAFEIESTTFDFSVDFDHRVNNRIHTAWSRKKQIDGFLLNVLRVGQRSREVAQEEYQRFFDLLTAKSLHQWRKKRRKQVITESREPERSNLP